MIKIILDLEHLKIIKKRYYFYIKYIGCFIECADTFSKLKKIQY